MDEPTENPVPRDDFDLQQFFPYLTRVFYKSVSSSITDLYSTSYDMTPPEWRTMAILGREGRLTAAEVVNRSSMDKVTVSRAVKKMSALGMLDKTSNQADGRSTVLYLSAKGRKVYLELVPKMLAVEQQLLKGVSSQDYQLLVQLFEQIRTNALQLGASKQ